MPRDGSARREAAGASGPESLCTHMRQRARTRGQAAGRAVPMRSVRLPHVLCSALVPPAALPLRPMASAGAGTEHLCSVRPDVLAAGISRLPSRHARSGAASRDLCGLPGPVPRAPAACGPTEAPRRLLPPPGRAGRLVCAARRGRHAPMRGPMRRHPLGGWRVHVLDVCARASRTLLPPSGHLQASNAVIDSEAPVGG